jgi:Na+:H+ antiporter, NhaA family
VLDDLGAVAIIAVFYTAELSGHMLAAAVAVLLAMGLLRAFDVARAWPYLLLGALLWVFVLRSGVHATVAGVCTGLMLPQTRAGGAGREVEHRLGPFVAWVVLPLFALSNAGFAIGGGKLFASPIAWAVALGLLLGKPAGILAGARVAATLGGGLPRGYSWRMLLPVAAFCGVGFTMSLFIAGLAFDADPRSFDAARLGVLGGSLLALAAGGLLSSWLWPVRRQRP